MDKIPAQKNIPPVEPRRRQAVLFFVAIFILALLVGAAYWGWFYGMDLAKKIWAWFLELFRSPLAQQGDYADGKISSVEKQAGGVFFTVESWTEALKKSVKFQFEAGDKTIVTEYRYGAAGFEQKNIAYQDLQIGDAVTVQTISEIVEDTPVAAVTVRRYIHQKN